MLVSDMKKVAVICDWLVSYAGAEKVVEAILEIFPAADIYTTVYKKENFLGTCFEKHNVFESFIAKLPKADRLYQKYLPLMPLAIEQFDLSSYDLIISSSHAIAKGIIASPDQLHICYCHSPIRYAWDFQSQYLNESSMGKGIKGKAIRYLLHKIRLWDVRTANGVDAFIANSKYISRRILKCYRRESTVIYPNVSVNDFEVVDNKGEYYFTASRLVPYKRIKLIVEAFAKMPDKKLVVIGKGEQEKAIIKAITPNVTFLGYQPFHVLKEHMQNCKAFVFAAEEDFGIIPVEAQACGTPVIAYGKGGTAETVLPGKTGILFEEQTSESIIDAVKKFEVEGVSYSASEIKNHAEFFSKDKFISSFRSFVDSEWDKFIKRF